MICPSLLFLSFPCEVNGYRPLILLLLSRGLSMTHILFCIFFLSLPIHDVPQVILLSLVNEYTDWMSQTETPIKRLDSLLDILSDGLIVSPLLRAGSLHQRHQMRRQMEAGKKSSSSSNDLTSKTFFYVFSHQSKSSRYDPRLGCPHGEELSYLFGAPIASSVYGLTSMGSLAMTNYTKEEISLSKDVINYFSNFAKYG